MKTCLYAIVSSLLMTVPALFAQYPNVRLTLNSDDQHETAIAVNPVNPKWLMAVWNDFRSEPYEPGYSFSTDGATTWTTEAVIPDHDGYEYGFDPSCAWDRYGNAYYCYVAHSEGQPVQRQIYVSKTTDFGANWQHSPVSVLTIDQDKPYIAIDNTGGSRDGYIYVSWTGFGPNKIYFARSTNGGASFETTAILDETPYQGNNPGTDPDALYIQGSFPAVGPNGEVYVIWHEINHATGGSIVFLRRSVDGGISFETAVQIGTFTKANTQRFFGSIRIMHFPSMAVDQNTGFIYVAYEDYETGSNDLCIEFLSIPPDFLNIDIYEFPIGMEGNQCFPSVCVDPSGRISLSFLQISSGNLLDCYLMECFLGHGAGIEFGTPILITSQQSNSTTGSWKCDYTGSASTIGRTYPLWFDFRNNNADTYASRVFTLPTSSSASATASGSVRKLVYANSRWHAVMYSSHDLYHLMSTNDGAAWFGYEKMNGTLPGTELRLESNSNASLFTYNSNLHAVFNQTDGIYYNRASLTGIWEQPKLLYAVTSPAISSFIDASGVGHVIWVQSNWTLGPSSYYLKYGTFNTADANPTLTGIATVTSGSVNYQTPAISVDGQGRPHAVWTKSGRIWHSIKTTSWSTPYEVSDGQTTCETPSLHTMGSLSYVAWTNGSPGETWYRSRNSNGTWNTKINQSQSAGFASVHPYISDVYGEPMILWSEQTASGYDTKYRFPESGQHGVLASSDSVVQYPSYAARSYQGAARVVGLWTEKQVTPFHLKTAYKNMFPYLGKQESEILSEIPATFELRRNSPNPFNPTTTIAFALPEETEVTLKVYDVLGREVAVLVNETKSAGRYQIAFDASRLASGVYIYRITAGDYVDSKKMVLIK